MLVENNVDSRILVIEDDEDIRFAIKTALELEGYTVELATNGREAMEVSSDVEATIRLIFLDLMMPEMDGWEFLKAIRVQPMFTGVPVVVLTAAGEKQKPEGATDLIKKPIDLDKLYDIAKKFVN